MKKDNFPIWILGISIMIFNTCMVAITGFPLTLLYNPLILLVLLWIER